MSTAAEDSGTGREEAFKGCPEVPRAEWEEHRLWHRTFASRLVAIHDHFRSDLRHIIALAKDGKGKSSAKDMYNIAQGVSWELSSLVRCGVPPSPRRFARLTRVRPASSLHAHHSIEDRAVFPIARRKVPARNAAFDVLDADHHAIDTATDEAVRCARSWADQTRAASDSSASDACALGDSGTVGALERFQQLLARHLRDEEDLVIPMMLQGHQLH